MKTLTAQEVHTLLKSGQIDKARRGGISQHFTWHEVLGRIRPSEVDEVTIGMLNNAVKMAVYMERVRDYFGKRPLVITSWLRVPSHNKRVGGASKSWHMTGLAVDFFIANKGVLNKEELARFKAFHKGGLGQNNRKGFIHIDLGADRDVLY